MVSVLIFLSSIDRFSSLYIIILDCILCILIYMQIHFLLLPATVLDIHQVMIQGLLHISQVIYFIFVLFEQFLEFFFPFSSRQEAFLYHMVVQTRLEQSKRESRQRYIECYIKINASHARHACHQHIRCIHPPQTRM
jgi:hypothetical protein